MTQKQHNAVLFLDVDGVIGQVGDDITDVWGDQTGIDSPSWGTVLTSPTLLKALGALPVQIVWATDWEDPISTFTTELMGISAPLEHLVREPRATIHWWKAGAGLAWLDAHPHVRRVVWVDDHMNNRDNRTGTHRDVLARELTARSIEHLLTVPAKNVGLTPTHLAAITRFLEAPLA